MEIKEQLDYYTSVIYRRENIMKRYLNNIFYEIIDFIKYEGIIIVTNYLM